MKPLHNQTVNIDGQRGATSQVEIVSQRKLRANRENAKKSTGPKTLIGKQYSRSNAVKHGLLARHSVDFVRLGEDPQEYRKLLSNLLVDYQPVGRAEELEVELIADCWWRRKRARRHENAVAHLGLQDVWERTHQIECYTPEQVDALILELQNAIEKVKMTGELPMELKPKVFTICPDFEPDWAMAEKQIEMEQDLAR